jgi:hypothetical protein
MDICKELRINSGVNRKLHVNNEDIERVERFTYLGSEVTADGGALEDVKHGLRRQMEPSYKSIHCGKIRTYIEKLRFNFLTAM